MHERRSLIVTSPLQTFHRAQRELSPFFCAQKKARHCGTLTRRTTDGQPRSMSFRIQVLRQKIHQLERTTAVDHFVDQIAFTAWQLLDHALRRGPDGFVGPMDTCREQQHERGVSEVHGKTQKIFLAVYRLFSFPYQPSTKRCLAVSIFRLPHKGTQAKRTGKGWKGMGTQG